MLFPAFYTAGQTPLIERLKKDISEVNPDQKLRAILLLCDQGYNLHPDTLMSYADAAYRLAKTDHDRVEADFYKSYALTTKGQIDSSLAMAQLCLSKIEKGFSDPILKLKVLNQMGRCYMRKNQYTEAIAMGLQVITGAEKHRDTILQMTGKTLVGWAYLEMGQQHQALQWHLRALHTTSNRMLHEKYSILFANLAINYNNLGKTDSAFHYINHAIDYARKHQNLFALSNSLAIQAQLFVRAGQAKLAEQPLQETVAIRKLIGDPFYIVSDMSQLGIYYAGNGQPEKGIAICLEGIALANEYRIETKLFFLYNTLAENYKAAGDMVKYGETLNKIITLKDSVYARNSANELAALQARFELQKKETTNMQLELNLTRKNFQVYGSLALSILVAVIAFLLFRNYRRKQQMKMELALAREKDQAEIAVREAEEKERKRIAADLHDNLGAYAASIAANLERISVPDKDDESVMAVQELRHNSDAIVSQLNDTIWTLKKDTLSLTAISDRIKIFVQRIQPSYPEVVIDIREKIIHDFRFPPIQAFHLFRIVQEAINNALRHSGCRHVGVYIEAEKCWQVSICDDGNGMQHKPVRLHRTGNGLSNMESRAMEAGWKIRWKSNPGNGTEVVITNTTN